VTDIIMPYMNGRELALKLHAQRPSMKVLYISGYAGEAIKERGMLEAGSVLLQKPFTNQTLLARVHEVLGGGQK